MVLMKNFYQYHFFKTDDLLNNKNTKLWKFYSYLIYEAGSAI